jgi:hypothetical protein
MSDELMVRSLALLAGSIDAQDEREQQAGERCGVSRAEHGCDWPDAVAERVLVLTAALTAERKAREQAEQERDRLQARVTALEAAMNPQDIADAVAALAPQDGHAAGCSRIGKPCECELHGHKVSPQDGQP